MMSVPRPVGAAFAVARSLASRCWRSAVVWAVWAMRDGAAMRARDRMMLRGILTPCGWSDCTGWVGERTQMIWNGVDAVQMFRVDVRIVFVLFAGWIVL